MDYEFQHMVAKIIATALLSISCCSSRAQTFSIQQHANNNKRYTIQFVRDSVAQFWFDDTLRRPYLHRIFAPDQVLISRGYPLMPLPNDTTDHPHQVGVRFTYEDVNGSDFWNNSPWPAADRKGKLGSIVVDNLLSQTKGAAAILQFHARWKDNQQQAILLDTTTLHFSKQANYYIIDWTTKLTALKPVTLGDVKDGTFGIRLRRELQIPWKGEQSGANGNYLSSSALTGHEVWGKRANWVMLHGQVQQQSISVVIIDHPKNLHYPAYWHARGYGLFAINSLAQKSFDAGKPAYTTRLQQGESLQLQYRLVIATGTTPLHKNTVTQLEKDFSLQ